MRKITYCMVIALMVLGMGLSGCDEGEVPFDPNAPLVISDANLKNYLITEEIKRYVGMPGVFANTGEKIDANGDGEISSLEASRVDVINCTRSDISSLEGIEHFVNLEYLDCSNNYLTSLDLSECAKLVYLNFSYNQIETLNLSGCIILGSLDCSFNQLDILNLPELSMLTRLDCSVNQLVTLNLSGLSVLENLDCSNNQLTTLNAVDYTTLKELQCARNNLTILNVLGCTALVNLDCSSNELTTLDVSSNVALKELDCSPMNDANGDNLLETLYVNEVHDTDDWIFPEETTIEIKVLEPSEVSNQKTKTN